VAVLAQAAAGNTSNLIVTPADVRAMTSLAYLNGSPKFPTLNSVLAAALRGNWSGFDWLVFGPEVAQGIYPLLTTACLDRHLDYDSWESFEKIKNAVFNNDPAKIGYVFDLQITAFCSGWPYHGQSNVPLSLKKPVLLITSDFDYNCPSEMSTYGFGQASGSSLVVRHGDDHGTLIFPSAARSVEFSYLNTGALPNVTNQTFLTVYPPGSKRGPIANPYLVPVGPAAGDIY